jgi:transposase
VTALHWSIVDEALAEAGVSSFGGRECVTLRNDRARAEVGAPRTIRLPEQYLPNVVAVGLYLEVIRHFASKRLGGEHPISVLAWFRPGTEDSRAQGMSASYNLASGGTAGGAHEDAAGADIRSAIGKHAELRLAHVDAWRFCEDASGIGRYMFGRDHVDLVFPGGSAARQWRTLPLSRPLISTEVAARRAAQILAHGLGERRSQHERLAEDIDMVAVAGRLRDALRELRGGAR